jgi:Flp pilus assembly protein TadD
MNDLQIQMKTGVDALNANDLAQAAAVFQEILKSYPDFDHALQLLGLTRFRQGLATEGEQLTRQAISLNPQNVHARNNLAAMLKDMGRLEESSIEFQQLYLLIPDDSQVCTNLAVVLTALGQIDEALRYSLEAITKAPQSGKAHQVHGLAQKEAGNLDAALASIRHSLRLEPHNPEFLSSLSFVLLEQKEYEEAENAARAALDIEPNRPDAHHNLGIALAREYQDEEAIIHLRRAIELDPRNAKAHCDLATTLCDQGHFDQAMALYQQAEALEPGLGIARFGMSILQLTRGDFINGWRNYEARKHTPELHAHYPAPLFPVWQGENLAGKRLFLYCEQGFGDTLQFLRFIPLLLAMGATIGLDAPPEMTGLIKDTGWSIEVLSRNEAEHEHFDYECALMSIPFVLRLDLKDLPGEVGYLKSNPKKRQYWLEKLGGHQRPRIGICWAGNPGHKNDHNRSIATELFSQICAGIEVDFISLQRDPYENELADFADKGIDLKNWSEEFFNLSETAALTDTLDLVITVDTVIAHLAGGLGKNTWVLVPHVPDWRWMEHRDDSPWYPSMRLFRQPEIGDWETVIAQLPSELQRFVNSCSA